MKEKLKIILLNSWFQALLLTIIIVIFLPDFSSKYQIRVVDSGMIESGNDPNIYTCDLNHDGYSEKVLSFEHQNKYSIQVLTHDGGIVDQWNAPGTIIQSTVRLTNGNYDSDNFDEIYTLYKRNDTLFLLCFEPMDSISPIFFKEKMVCILDAQYAVPDPTIPSLIFQDIDGDGNGDLFFVINSGKAKFPRNLFVYDIAKDSISISKDYGSTFNTEVQFFDVDNDGRMEICGNMYAAGQVPDSLGYKYNDYSTWLMVFNHKLELLFEPIEFPGFRSELSVSPVSINGSKLLACYYNHRGPNDNYPKLFLAKTDGTIIKEHLFLKSSKILRWLNAVSTEDGLFLHLIGENGMISIFNQDLELVKKVNLGPTIISNFKMADLDLDGIEEFVLSTRNKEIIITENDLSNPATFTIDFPPTTLNLLMHNKNTTPSLFFYNDSDYLSLQYSDNLFASLRFLIYLGIYLAIWLFIWLIRKLHNIQIKNKNMIRTQIMELQLKTIKNQMDPHFTFNVFNTIAAMIQKESPSIYKPFLKFTDLIRNSLESTDKITRPLSQEILFLQNYLDLEILRSPDIFDYSIDISDDLDLGKKVPKMLLQIYVENAIKHGLRLKEEKGMLNISIVKNENSIEIEVTDNGIGRAKAKELSTGTTGLGLKIMEDYFRLFNEYNHSKIQHEIIDLFDDNHHPAGTCVRISIPLNFSYRISENER